MTMRRATGRPMEPNSPLLSLRNANSISIGDKAPRSLHEAASPELGSKMEPPLGLSPNGLCVRSRGNDLLAYNGDVLACKARKVGLYEEFKLFARSILASPFGHPLLSLEWQANKT